MSHGKLKYCQNDSDWLKRSEHPHVHVMKLILALAVLRFPNAPLNFSSLQFAVTLHFPSAATCSL